MAITSLDGVIAGLKVPEFCSKVATTGEAAGELFSTFYTGGRPGGANAPTPGLAGIAVTGYNGQIPFPSSFSGKSVYLAGMDACQGGNIGAVILVDRLWHNSGIVVTTTTSQTINSVNLPPRDGTGAILGYNVLAGIEVSAATGNGGAITNTTISYTEQGGTSGRTGTIASFPATAVAGHFSPFTLASGDNGIKSIQSITLGTSYVSGTIHLVMYRVIAVIPTPTANVPVRYDALQLGMPRMFDQSVPYFLYQINGTALGVMSSTVTFTQG